MSSRYAEGSFAITTYVTAGVLTTSSGTAFSYGLVDPQIVSSGNSLVTVPGIESTTDTQWTVEHAVPGGWPRDYFPESYAPQLRVISGAAQAAFNACIMRPFGGGRFPTG